MPGADNRARRLGLEADIFAIAAAQDVTFAVDMVDFVAGQSAGLSRLAGGNFLRAGDRKPCGLFAEGATRRHISPRRLSRENQNDHSAENFDAPHGKIPQDSDPPKKSAI